MFRGKVNFRSIADLPIRTKTMTQFYLLSDSEMTWRCLPSEGCGSVFGIIHLDHWQGCEVYRNYRVSRTVEALNQPDWMKQEQSRSWAELNLAGKNYLFNKYQQGWRLTQDGLKQGKNETAEFYRRFKAFRFLRI